MSGWVLAVDIGATSVAAAVWERGRIEVLELAEGPTLPPAVFCPDGQPPLAGLAAVERAAPEPGHAVLSPKRALAEGSMVTVGGAALALAQVYAALLTAVAREAARLREPSIPDWLVLTYPAAWEQRERAVLRSAARNAGLPAPAFVAEPVAASWELAADCTPGQVVAILDVGVAASTRLCSAGPRTGLSSPDRQGAWPGTQTTRPKRPGGEEPTSSWPPLPAQA